jgi:hypothetical protein
MSLEEKDLLKKAEKKKAAKKLSRKLDAVWWSLFFIWIGVVMITGADTPAAFVGIGTIMLGVQGARGYFQLKVEKFWTIVGLLFLVGGLWETFDLSAPFGAFVLIIIGVLILFSTFGREGASKDEKEKVPANQPPEE